jgi:hypothetical protein
MKKKYIQAIVAIGLVLLAVGMVYAYMIWNKPQRDVKEETAIAVQAQALFDAYTNNENQANTTYLDKAVAVTGEVTQVQTNQQQQQVLTLKTADPMFGVQCTMKEPSSATVGSTVTVKGICTGFLMDVVIIDCYISQ